MNTINLSQTDSLGDAIKQIKNSSFIAVIFNQSSDNSFLSYGFDSGVLCLYYWRGYWDGHILFLVFGDKNKMATGLIEQSTNTITNIYTFNGANAS